MTMDDELLASWDAYCTNETVHQMGNWSIMTYMEPYEAKKMIT